MSLNVRRRSMIGSWRRADRWTVRRTGLAELLRGEQPTLLGAQEALPDQEAFIRSALGPAYRAVGRGRGPRGGDEACPIFYDDERLELLAWEQLALSDRPHEAGSVSWGNLIPRIAVIATLRDRFTRGTLIVLNTHLDHLSNRSRVRSVGMIRDRVAGARMPAVVTGDFNAAPGTPAVDALLGDGALVDAWAAAGHPATAAPGTYTNYREPRAGHRRIDLIAVTPTITVHRASVNAQRYAGVWVSDHLPIQAEVTLPGTEAAR